MRSAISTTVVYTRAEEDEGDQSVIRWMDTQGQCQLNPPQHIVQPNWAKIEPEAQYLIPNFTTHIFCDLICTGIHPIKVHTLVMTSRAGLLQTEEATGDVGDA